MQRGRGKGSGVVFGYSGSPPPLGTSQLSLPANTSARCCISVGNPKAFNPTYGNTPGHQQSHAHYLPKTEGKVPSHFIHATDVICRKKEHVVQASCPCNLPVLLRCPAAQYHIAYTPLWSLQWAKQWSHCREH